MRPPLFRKAFDEFFRLVCSCPVTGEAEDAWLAYKVVFSRNLPESLLEQAETAAKLAVGFFPRTLVMLVFAVVFWLACVHWFQSVQPILSVR